MLFLIEADRMSPGRLQRFLHELKPDVIFVGVPGTENAMRGVDSADVYVSHNIFESIEEIRKVVYLDGWLEYGGLNKIDEKEQEARGCNWAVDTLAPHYSKYPEGVMVVLTTGTMMGYIHRSLTEMQENADLVVHADRTAALVAAYDLTVLGRVYMVKQLQ